MKLYVDGPHGNKIRNICDGLWQLFVLSLLAFTLLFFASEVRAAQITFTPDNVTVNVAPGETVSVPISVSLEETALPNSYASFGLAHVGGDLDRTWLNNQVYISLNSWYKTRQVVLQLRVPENAQGGVYSGILKTVWLRSNENIAPVELTLNVDVDAFVGCSQVPLFSDIVASGQSIEVPNNKETIVELSGTVSAPEGCEVANPQYQLVDEYGELDTTASFEVNDDGSFNVSVPVLASRKGNDKDGRLYTIKLMAEDDAGVGESTETSIVVGHDNRKK